MTGAGWGRRQALWGLAVAVWMGEMLAVPSLLEIDKLRASDDAGLGMIPIEFVGYFNRVGDRENRRTHVETSKAGVESKLARGSSAARKKCVLLIM